MRLFNTDGPLLSGLNILTDLVVLNLITVLMCLPVFTAGASLSAMHLLAREILNDRESRPVHRFFEAFRERIKTGAAVFLPMLFIALIGFLEAGFLLLRENRTATVYAYVLIAAVFFAAFLENTALLLLSYSPAPVRELAANTLRLAFGRFPRMLAASFVMLLPFFIILTMPVLIPLFFLAGLTVPAALSARVYEPVTDSLGRKESWHP